MRRPVLLVIALVLLTSAASAQLDLNNQSISRQNPINSPVPPPPPAPLPVPGSGLPAASGAMPVAPRLSSGPAARVHRVSRERGHAANIRHGRKGRPETARSEGDKRGRAAVEEQDRLLNTKLKSICRGC